MTDDTSTRKFTDMDAMRLKDSMARFEGVCVVATVNPDGTPDASIFMPAMPDLANATACAFSAGS